MVAARGHLRRGADEDDRVADDVAPRVLHLDPDADRLVHGGDGIRRERHLVDDEPLVLRDVLGVDGLLAVRQRDDPVVGLSLHRIGGRENASELPRLFLATAFEAERLPGVQVDRRVLGLGLAADAPSRATNSKPLSRACSNRLVSCGSVSRIAGNTCFSTLGFV